MGKLIVLEWMDCTGKETQTKLLTEKMQGHKISVGYFSFPNYESPTGKIIGGPYLWKQSICDWYFREGASNVDPKVASLYFAADRLYNLPEIEKRRKNQHLILDRYVYSNMAHQWGKLLDLSDRKKLYQRIDQLEFNFLWLPKADIRILLYLPLEWTLQLQKNRRELDQHEGNTQYLKIAEQAYLEIAQLYDFMVVQCVEQGKLRTIENINDELYNMVVSCL